MNGRGDLSNYPPHSLNTAKYLVNDLYHSLKRRHHAANYGSNPMNEPPYSINDIHHSAKFINIHRMIVIVHHIIAFIP